MEHDTSTARQKEIFIAALEIADAAERARFLDSACAGDATLRGRVEVLLRADADAGKFLEPAVVPGDSIKYFGDYVLMDEIARGSAGVVFRARQTSLNRVVALKMLRDRPLLTNEDDLRRFRAEAQAAAGLDHPGIVPIYEVGEHAGQGYFSMKFIEGGSLYLRAGEFRDPRKAAALIVQVARAVHHAHERGILHRDLKPGNILIDRTGAPLVVDFGIARLMGVDSTLTHTGQIVGTPHYMAPEQARGANRELTAAADIYSLGAILYELLAGRRVFASGDFVELLRQVAESPAPPLPPAVPPALAAVAMKCLEKSPAARFGTAGELADDLERWLRGERVRATKVRRFPWKPMLVASAAILLAFGGKALWERHRGVISVTTLEDELDPVGTDGSGVSLREALRDVAEHGRVQFSKPGKIILSNALGPIQIVKSVHIEGASTEIHAGAAIDRTFFIAAKSRLVLANITLSGEVENARLRGSVGAIENNGELVAVDCRFLNHGGGGSGGAITSAGGLTLRRCVFQNNVTNMIGGALQITGANSPVEIEDCLFTGNRAAGIGGSAINITIPASAARVRLVRCTITGNTWQPETKRQRRTEPLPENSGGALRIHSGTVSVEQCVIAGNQAPEGAESDVLGVHTAVAPNFIGGDPKDAPAGLGARLK